jgi:hypothetical protein
MRNRMSSLGVAVYCGLSPRLGRQHGAGRAAAIGTAFHRLAEGVGPNVALANLTEEEAAEVRTMRMPEPAQVGGKLLTYDDAHIEEEVRLPVDGEDLVGHVDMYWTSSDTVYVGDIKRSKWTVSGPETLQLLAYAYALADNLGLDSFYTGIWAATEGEWTWSREYTMFGDGDALWAKIRHAAMNEEPNRGDHCGDCWERMACPEYLLPVAGDSWLAALSEHAELTNDSAREMLLKVQAAKKVVKAVDDELKEFARRTGGIGNPQTGKVWRPSVVVGKSTTISVEAVRAKFPEIADQLIKQGAPYARYSWRKA